MVLAYHLVWVAYGWWLPNDLRGSMSGFIASDVIADLGALHHGRKKVQPASRDIRAFYERAKDALKFPLLRFSPEELHAVIISFGEVIQRFGYTCYACAILPDHVHLCIRKHKDLAEDMILNLQLASAEAVRKMELRAGNHPVWGGSGWKVFLDSVEDIERTNGYIRDNPRKLGMAPQFFHFVTPYDGWPLHHKKRGRK
jgi:REP element-mobilizing transposase RayT